MKRTTNPKATKTKSDEKEEGKDETLVKVAEELSKENGQPHDDGDGDEGGKVEGKTGNKGEDEDKEGEGEKNEVKEKGEDEEESLDLDALESYSVVKLRKYCKDEGLKIKGKGAKRDYINAIKAYNDEPVEGVKEDQKKGKGQGKEDKGKKEGEEEFEVEAIRATKTMKGVGKAYLVKWKGYAEKHNTWEPEKNLAHCTKLLEDFHKKEEEKQSKKRKAPARSSSSAAKRTGTRRSTRTSSRASSEKGEPAAKKSRRKSVAYGESSSSSGEEDADHPWLRQVRKRIGRNAKVLEGAEPLGVSKEEWDAFMKMHEDAGRKAFVLKVKADSLWTLVATTTNIENAQREWVINRWLGESGILGLHLAKHGWKGKLTKDGQEAFFLLLPFVPSYTLPDIIKSPTRKDLSDHELLDGLLFLLKAVASSLPVNEPFVNDHAGSIRFWHGDLKSNQVLCTMQKRDDKHEWLLTDFSQFKLQWVQGFVTMSINVDHSLPSRGKNSGATTSAGPSHAIDNPTAQDLARLVTLFADAMQDRTVAKELEGLAEKAIVREESWVIKQVFRLYDAKK